MGMDVILSVTMSIVLWWWYFSLKKELRDRGYRRRWAFKTTLICAVLVTIVALITIFQFLIGDTSGHQESVYSESGVHSGSR